MKLLVIAPYFYPKIGGLEKYAWHISRGLKKSFGWEIVAVTANHAENIYQVETIEGIKIYRLPYWFKLSNTPINPNWFMTIARIIDHEQPDVINAHTPVPFIADVAAILSSIKKIPFVLTYHNDLVKQNILDLLFKIYYHTVGKVVGSIAHGIIVTSPYYANASSYLKQYRNKLHTIPPGVHLDYIDAIEPHSHLIEHYKNKKIVLFVGQMDHTHQHKGVTYLIESMKKLSKTIKDVHLILIGNGTMIDEYKRMGEDISMEILTDISDDGLHIYYKLAQVVVLPSVSEAEGFGITLIEAGASKKPVVGSRVGGIPYVIEHDVTGLLSKPGDSDDLAQQLKQIFTDTKRAQRMGHEGYKKVRSGYTWDKQIRLAHDFLSTL